ncbi:MAG: TonB-dependent receptor [Verrucomicrobiota bacterium]
MNRYRPVISRIFLFLAIASCTIFPAKAQVSETFDFDIESQPLADALEAFSKTTGVAVATSGNGLAGRSAPSLSGSYTAREALFGLLGGSGLKFEFVSDDSVAIRNPGFSKSGNVVQLNDLVLKGELIERSLQDTLTSVAVASGTELESRGEVDLYDLIERTPGVGILSGESGFSIRGISQRGGGGDGLTVSTTVDGATISNSNRATFFGPYSTWDLEQVEIFRGPQSTQTGRNALAGAIVIRSKDPVYNPESKFRVEVGEFGRLGGAFAVNTPLVENKVAIRISGEAVESDGAIENITRGGDENASEDETLRLSLRADPTERFSVILKHWIQDRKVGERAFTRSLGLGNRQATADFEGKKTNRTESTNLRLAYELDTSFRVELESNYYENEWRFFSDADGAALPGNTRVDAGDVETTQHELKLLHEGERFKGVLGAFYTDFNQVGAGGGFAGTGAFVNQVLLGGVPLFPADITFDTTSEGGGAETENYAVFGEMEYQLTDRIDATFGFRYDWEDTQTILGRSFNDYDPAFLGGFFDLSNFLGPAGESVAGEDRSASFEAFLPKLTLGYDITEDVRVGFSAQRGYRAGGSRISPIIGEYNFDPEYTWNYEISLRSQSFDDQLTVNANVFYMDWEDQQILQRVSLPGLDPDSVIADFQVVNAGKSRLYGGEIDVRAQPTPDLELFASLAYVNTKYIEFVTSTADNSGNEFPGAPEITAALGGTYRFGEQWYVSADASFTDENWTSEANADVWDSRTLYNARIGYDADSWSVFLYGRNLTDKLYEIAGGTLTSSTVVSVGEPRVVGAVWQFSF